jgi:ABC-type Fe3+-hydroxamate transport system substrate-binding protein
MTADNTMKHEVSTRRDIVKTGGTLLGGGLLAGCLGGGGSTTSPTEEHTDQATTITDGKTETSAQSNQSYSVTMSPAGTVEFEEPPTNVMVYNLLYADMAVAYGYGDAVNSLGFSTEVGGALDAFYAHLEDVSFDHESLTQLNTGSGNLTVDMELFYELDSDLHLVDPALIASFDGWTVDDIEEIRENIAPFFGNNYSRRNTEPPEPYRDDYEYYTLWEISEKVAKVFQAQQRHEALASIHDDLLATIQSDLPPESERPTVGSVLYMGETFYPAKINTPGFANAHTRPLGATDAFAEGDISYESSYDFETMVEINPDIILHRYGYSYYDVEAIREELSNHAVGQQLSAVQSGRVYAGGNPLQGPVMNLFQLEMTAKQLYPDAFGEWPTYAGGPYPEIPEGEQLFDRQRVANVINGNF